VVELGVGVTAVVVEGWSIVRGAWGEVDPK
jgi:hypothetical protein